MERVLVVNISCKYANLSQSIAQSGYEDLLFSHFYTFLSLFKDYSKIYMLGYGELLLSADDEDLEESPKQGEEDDINSKGYDDLIQSLVAIMFGSEDQPAINSFRENTELSIDLLEEENITILRNKSYLLDSQKAIDKIKTWIVQATDVVFEPTNDYVAIPESATYEDVKDVVGEFYFLDLG